MILLRISCPPTFRKGMQSVFGVQMREVGKVAGYVVNTERRTAEYVAVKELVVKELSDSSFLGAFV